MHPLRSDHFRKATGWLTAATGALCLLLLTSVFVKMHSVPWQARLLPAHMRGETPWKTLTAANVIAGYSVPAHTNIIFSLPPTMQHVSRETLFGHKENVRYWGYCFPEHQTQITSTKRFPGTMFLSEREEELSDQQLNSLRRSQFSVLENPDEGFLNQNERLVHPIIRNQKGTFRGGETCYLMSEQPLPIGLDEDKDLLNAKVEQQYRTSPNDPDTDDDGIPDGFEVIRAQTNPALRDSDSDGLIDGIEDTDRDGRVDLGETNPDAWDTDRDGLCDGYCILKGGLRDGFSSPVGFNQVNLSNILGEDKNLNGKVDPGEFDPRVTDTDGDGILDSQEYFSCLLSGQTSC
ncbi:MAG TPA: hypothetical protein VI913_05860 [Candidatus Peribacteraceae bacterium]|nr:hypothetical protein [Candidatus Peribacteraceae bacterium]